MIKAFPPSTRYESWITRLRQPWMTVIGKRIWGAFAAALGDRALDWGLQANLEHLPEYASDPASVNLIASERQIDPGPTETQAALATRLTLAVPAWQRASSALGLLLAIRAGEYGQAVVVQQNGRAFLLASQGAFIPSYVTQTIDFGDATDYLWMVDLSGLNPQVNGNQPIATGAHPWWAIDQSSLDGANNQYSSRFQILFPNGDLSSGDVPRLRNIITKWRPMKLCAGIFNLTSGQFWGWIPETWGSGGNWGPSTTDIYAGV